MATQRSANQAVAKLTKLAALCEFSSKFSVFAYEKGCVWGAKLQKPKFQRPG